MMRSPEKPADFVESLSNDRPDFADEFRKRALEAKTRTSTEELEPMPVIREIRQ